MAENLKFNAGISNIGFKPRDKKQRRGNKVNDCNANQNANANAPFQAEDTPQTLVGSGIDDGAPIIFEGSGDFSFNVSKDFLSPSILSFCSRNAISCFADCRDKEKAQLINTEIENFSKIYRDTHTVRSHSENRAISELLTSEGRLTVLKKKNKLGEYIIKILDCEEKTEEKKLLFIKSPLGSYKNKFLQFIYLFLLGNAKTVLPVYIDLSRYENSDISVDGLIDNLKHILLLAKNDGRTALFIFDCVRIFECGMEGVYEKIGDFVNSADTNCKILTGADTLYTVSNRRYKAGLTEFEGYENRINISSANLDKVEESTNFIKNCVDCFFSEKNTASTPAELRSLFINLEMVSIDAYIVKKILSVMISKYGGRNMPKSNVKIFTSVLGNISAKSYASVYDYNYTDTPYSQLAERGEWWKKATEHRSIIDFCIAKHYFSILRNIYCNTKDFSAIPAAVTNNAVNRFLVGLFNENGDTQNWIDFIKFISESLEKEEENHYLARCPDSVKAQICFLIGRVSREARRQLDANYGINICELLTKMRKLFALGIEEERKAFENTDKKDTALRRALHMRYFVLRTIDISLINCLDAIALNSYLLSLVKDGLASEINRGYHLDYYGDIPFSNRNFDEPLKVNLGDIANVGVNSLRKLSIKIRNILNIPSEERTLLNFFTLSLSLMTYCDLLETRRFSKEQRVEQFYMKEHLASAEDFLNEFSVILEDERYKDILLPQLREYFLKKREGLTRDAFNKFSKGLANTREGWKIRGAENAESISSHMHNAYMMGRIFLPQEFTSEEYEGEYDKKVILELLTVHDVGEAETGDILSKDKTGEDREREQSAMRSFFETYYPEDEGGMLFELWKDAESENPRNINAKIAKEIDYIQSVYQYLKYSEEGRLATDSEDREKWLSGLDVKVSTDAGKRIARLLITEGDNF